MTPYYSEAGITIYHGDCREVLPTLDTASIDAVISDPPYGMNLNTDTRRFSGGIAHNNRKRGEGANRSRIHGDTSPFDPSPWINFPRVVLWGFNHFSQRVLPGTSLVWIKKHPHLFGTFLSDAEIGWMKGGCGVYVDFCEWSNTNRMSQETHPFSHPTQKPVPLMAWCIEKAKVPAGGLILDPYMGSGSTLVAAKLGGYRGIGIEISEAYAEIAANRCRQGVLFGGAA